MPPSPTCTLHLIPGSHRERYEHRRDPDSDHHIRAWPPEERAVPIELEAGGVAFFCYGTAHSTRANTTDRERAGMAFHFLHTPSRLRGLRPGRGRPPHPALRDRSPRHRWPGGIRWSTSRRHMGTGSAAVRERAGPGAPFDRRWWRRPPTYRQPVPAAPRPDVPQAGPPRVVGARDFNRRSLARRCGSSAMAPSANGSPDPRSGCPDPVIRHHIRPGRERVPMPSARCLHVGSTGHDLAGGVPLSADYAVRSGRPPHPALRDRSDRSGLRGRRRRHMGTGSAARDGALHRG